MIFYVSNVPLQIAKLRIFSNADLWKIHKWNFYFNFFSRNQIQTDCCQRLMSRWKYQFSYDHWSQASSDGWRPSGEWWVLLYIFRSQLYDLGSTFLQLRGWYGWSVIWLRRSQIELRRRFLTVDEKRAAAKYTSNQPFLLWAIMLALRLDWSTAAFTRRFYPTKTGWAQDAQLTSVVACTTWTGISSWNQQLK